MAQIIVFLKIVLLLITPSLVQSQNWLCVKGGMHIALVYDCRGNLNQQHNFFTQFLFNFKPAEWIHHNDKSRALRVSLRLSLMTYGTRELETAWTLTQANYTLDGFNNAFRNMLNKSVFSCPEEISIEDTLAKTTEELNKMTKNLQDTATKMRKLAIFILSEDASVNTLKRHKEQLLRFDLDAKSNIKRLLIVVTPGTNLKSTETNIIYTKDLDNTIDLIEKSLYAICNFCDFNSEGYRLEESCYYIAEESRELTAREVDTVCGEKWSQSRVISINTKLEDYSVFSFINSYQNSYTNYDVIAKDESLKHPNRVEQKNKDFNVIIGLTRTTNFEGDEYIWNDGGPFVLFHEWQPGHNKSGCFYISYQLQTEHQGIKDIWKEVDCDQKIKNIKLLCEKKMHFKKKLGDNELSFKSIIRQGISFLINMGFFKPFTSRIIKNTTDKVSSMRVLPDINVMPCQIRSPDESDYKELDFLCRTIRAKGISSSRAGKFYQIYISGATDSSDYVLYQLKVRDNKELCPDSLWVRNNIKENTMSYVKHCYNTSYIDSEIKIISATEFKRMVDSEKPCLYDVDLKRKRIGFKNNINLQECNNSPCTKVCSQCVQCPHSYCVRTYMVDDGIIDCPDGEDENTVSDDKVVCHAVFKFTLREMCVQRKIYQDVLQADGNVLKYDCQHRCHSDFVCVSNTVRNDRSLHPTYSFMLVEANVKIYHLSKSHVLTPQVYTLTPYLELLEINVHGCGITDYSKIFDDINFDEIRSLDMSYNDIKCSNGLSKIDQMINLKKFNVSYNKNLKFLPNFSLPLGIESIDLSSTLVSEEIIKSLLRSPKLTILELRHVKPIDFSKGWKKQLDILDIRGTELINIKDGYLSWLSIQTALYTDDFRICCDVIRGPNIPEDKCHAPRDAISTCQDMIGDPLKRVILWVVGVLSLLGNMVVIIYRLIWDRAAFKTAYGIFVVCLGVSDFIMGVYLLIIAGADLLYRNLYVLNDNSWRHGNVCKLAGVLSTFSSETSTMFICLITIDRFLVIRYPFGQHRFTKAGKITSLFFSVAMGVVVSVIPALFPGWEIYSSNAMCLALPFSSGRHTGWEYSAVLFVGLNFVLFILIAIGQLAIFLAITSYKDKSLFSTRDKSRKSQDFAVAKQLFMVALTDFGCWFPIGIMGIMSVNGYHFDLDVYAWSAVLILPVNSAINPIIYTLPAIHRKFKSITIK